MKMKGKTGIFIWILALALLAGTAAFAAKYDEFDSIGGYLLILVVIHCT